MLHTDHPEHRLPSYTLANFRLNWADIMGSRVSGAQFVDNAFDEEYYTGASPWGRCST